MHDKFLLRNAEERHGTLSDMGRYSLLWLLGVPNLILVQLWIFGGLH